jgi:hypothetical protein
MYYPNAIEDVCYDEAHINIVMEEIKKNLPDYFQKYIETEGGNHLTDDVAIKLAAAFGATNRPDPKPKNAKKVLEHCFTEAVKDFNSDRQIYQEILHLDSMVEYKVDVPSFKNKVLKDQIPIIRKTLQNKAAKELDKYRIAFNIAQPGNLFIVVENIITLAEDWKHNWYDAKEFEQIKTCGDLDYHQLDEDEYSAHGVIGGGIKTHFIYKLYPEMYPNRSREALWALYYLTDKKHFNCKQDSEFLMINVEAGTTQQNYFYPYGLFAFYALKIYEELKKIYAKNGISLSIEYRFVAVDAFLSFVSRQHQKEIDILKQKSENLHYDY